ncbi:glutamyl-tRNA b subunit [Niveomyces insectorum RCEF 264]|uniref:Glutamyl-tRNA(Gln) amidotransferase subunit B, mitochondrial n=1 Tax=Niveomyces insectorum RCEF 264 TaxID=1081102 RepID=A0A167XQ98_9HYPO|nr:glutamyl-tRNA b subunit [Niveomyces insectorum RCEF 264]
MATVVPATQFHRSLLRARWPRRAAPYCLRCTPWAAFFGRSRRHTSPYSTTTTTTSTTASPASSPPSRPVSLRKQLKDEAKARKAAAGPATHKPSHRRGQTVPGWELTVGIEIHAQLNTARKLFSAAAAAADADADARNAAVGDTETDAGGTNGTAPLPNTHVAYFDLALPGAQPLFQPATLVPAVRAALALNCTVHRVSRFDRKHYFHWDQPAGYQITQRYEPLATRGHLALYARDGIAPEDGAAVRIDIEQVQLEQDTAKTLLQPGGSSSSSSSSSSSGGGRVRWLDYNRVGMPLVEIITAPQIHHPATAAALVRKVQLLLRAVDACTAGMEAGGLRADVNVSVRRVHDGDNHAAQNQQQQEQPGPLGTRTEIKNLNSFRAVEDAIIAERNRQIDALERGDLDAVVSETRGWTPATGSGGGGGGGETHRLRGKEGDVDYRYMPDPDLGPLVLDEALLARLRQTSGVLPDAELDNLVAHYGLTPKDAMALVLLDDGGRAQYYYDVVAAFEARLPADASKGASGIPAAAPAYRAFVANWVLHQLGRLTSERNSSSSSPAADGESSGGSSSSSGSSSSNELTITPEGHCARLPAACLADILVYRYQGRITASVAKELLYAVFRGDIGDGGAERGNSTTTTTTTTSVREAIDRDHLWFDEVSDAEYAALAAQTLAGEPDKTLRLFVDPVRYPQGKLQYLVGKLLRLGPPGRTDPQHAEAAVRAAIEAHVAQRKAAAATNG